MLTNGEIHPFDEIWKCLFFHCRQKVTNKLNKNTFILLGTALFNFLVSWYILSLFARVYMETCLRATCCMATNGFGVVSSIFNAAFSYLIRLISYYNFMYFILLCIFSSNYRVAKRHQRSCPIGSPSTQITCPILMPVTMERGWVQNLAAPCKRWSSGSTAIGDEGN